MLLGLLVGMLVGLTGVGGGALLTPLLVLVAGVRPSLAVGTDLAFAALTKLVGAWQHWRNGTVDLGCTLRLACGSVPGALLGAQALSALEAGGAGHADVVLARLLGLALLAAAGASLLRAAGVTWRAPAGTRAGVVPSVLIGLGVGLLVGLTSVGAGSLLMAVFALFYTLPARRAVGTDVAHGAVLAAVAAVAHGLAGRVEGPLLMSLLVGSAPGVVLGGWLCRHLPGRPLRLGIAVVLAVTGARLL